MYNRNGNESSKVDASENRINSLNLIDDYMTPLERNKIPFKKLNFKTNNYKKRLTYAKLEKMGIVNDDLRILIALETVEDLQNYNNDRDKNLSELINCDKSNNKNTISSNYPKFSDSNLEENILNKLIYDADLDFNLRESKREINLKKLLNDKLKKFVEINKIKRNNNLNS